MTDALEKTLILILLMFSGFLLKTKIKSTDQINGIKEIVLSVALPSMIFIALMNIRVDSTLLLIPVLTIIFNFFIYGITPRALPLFGVKPDSPTGRTLVMLMPSLAPGLSCLPFIAEFLGDKSVAIGALADVGNKFFVLIFLYFIALNMFLKKNRQQEQRPSEKIRSLLLSLIREPINMVILLAGILLLAGYSYRSLPGVISGVLDKTSSMMTPLVLIYIGLAVQLKKGIKRVVLSMLVFRSGITLLFSTLLIALLGIQDPLMALITLAIPQSSASFWPFAHISFFNSKEALMNVPLKDRTFNLEQAVLILAFSLPFSTLMILGILGSGRLFLNPVASITAGIALIILSMSVTIFSKFRSMKQNSLVKSGM